MPLPAMPRRLSISSPAPFAVENPGGALDVLNDGRRRDFFSRYAGTGLVILIPGVFIEGPLRARRNRRAARRHQEADT
jgi:hypothetical protein